MDLAAISTTSRIIALITVGCLLTTQQAAALSKTFNTDRYTDAGSWGAPEHYSTIIVLDFNGDGYDDVCARGDEGLQCMPSMGEGNGFGTSFGTDRYTDAGGWDAPEHYSTIMALDFNGDGFDDVCARGNEGLQCMPSIGEGNGFGTSFGTGRYTDAGGWAATEHYSTIMALDFNGDGFDDVCARGNEGLQCMPSLGEGNGFGTSFGTGRYTDAGGWAAPEHYSTIMALDFNGDGLDDVCARGNEGLQCMQSFGNGFGTSFGTDRYTDAGGWDAPEHYSTIMALDFNGDGLDDVCARGNGGLQCMPSTGDGYGISFGTGLFTDFGNWNQRVFYSTIFSIDFNGDGRDDLCARGFNGLLCGTSNGAGFDTLERTNLLTGSSWFQRKSYSTIRVLDFNGDGQQDFCARSVDGLVCSRAGIRSYSCERQDLHTIEASRMVDRDFSPFANYEIFGRLSASPIYVTPTSAASVDAEVTVRTACSAQAFEIPQQSSCFIFPPTNIQALQEATPRVYFGTGGQRQTRYDSALATPYRSLISLAPDRFEQGEYRLSSDDGYGGSAGSLSVGVSLGPVGIAFTPPPTDQQSVIVPLQLGTNSNPVDSAIEIGNVLFKESFFDDTQRGEFGPVSSFQLENFRIIGSELVDPDDQTETGRVYFTLPIFSDYEPGNADSGYVGELLGTLRLSSCYVRGGNLRQPSYTMSLDPSEIEVGQTATLTVRIDNHSEVVDLMDGNVAIDQGNFDSRVELSQTSPPNVNFSVIAAGESTELTFALQGTALGQVTLQLSEVNGRWGVPATTEEDPLLSSANTQAVTIRVVENAIETPIFSNGFE